MNIEVQNDKYGRTITLALKSITNKAGITIHTLGSRYRIIEMADGSLSADDQGSRQLLGRTEVVDGKTIFNANSSSHYHGGIFHKVGEVNGVADLFQKIFKISCETLKK